LKEYEKQKQEYEVDLSKWKQARKANKNLPQPDKPDPPIKQYCLISDITTEALIPILADNPFGLCGSYNEAAVLLGGMDAYRSGGNKDEGVFNSIFDGGFVQVNRKTGNQDTMAEHSHFSINGGIQPKSFRLILKQNPQFFFSGFFARFLLSMPPDTPRYIREISVPKDIKAAYVQMIETLFFWRGKLERVSDDSLPVNPRNPFLVKLTPEAKELFFSYQHSTEDDRCSLPSGAMKASLSKLSGYVPRVALALHIANFAANCPSGSIPTSFPDLEEETMEAAITLVKWFRREIQRVLQKAHPTEVLDGDTEITAIMKHLEKRKDTTARKVAQNLAAFGGKGATDKAERKLDEMVLKGLLVCKERKAGNGIKSKHYSFPRVPDEACANSNTIPDSDATSEGEGEDYSSYFTVVPTAPPKNKPNDEDTTKRWKKREEKDWERKEWRRNDDDLVVIPM